MGDEENQLRRSERNKNKRPARFEAFYLGEPIDKMARTNEQIEEELNQTVRENDGIEEQQVQINVPEPPADPFEEMKQLMNRMALTINNSLEAMDKKIDDSRVTIQKNLQDNT